MASNNLYLIGYRATGKTTVAQLLATRLNWVSIDADDVIEEHAGMPIREIFETSGETAFRDLETAVVKELSQRSETVVALGGGAVLRSENRSQLTGTGPMIWLQADPETIANRISGDLTTTARRPDLTKSGGLQEIQELLIVRKSVYQECADHQVDTDNKSPESISEEIHSWFVQCGCGDG